jgi:hypothetical protein
VLLPKKKKKVVIAIVAAEVATAVAVIRLNKYKLNIS